VTGDRAAAWFGWATVSLTVPFAFQAFTVYPDGLGAAFVMAGAFTLLMAERASTLQLAATGIALGLLPWLHTRFAVSAGMLGIVIAARLLPTPDRVRRLAAFLAAPAVMAVGWFLFFYILYGSPNPAIAYNGYTQSAVGNIPRSLTGLLFDQQFGLLPNAPAYLCAFAGFIPLVRRQPRVAGELAAVIVPYTLAAALFYMWWGGFASPARFLASMLLVFAIPAAMWFSAAGRSARTLGLLLLAISVALSITTASVDRGALLYNVRDGASKMLIWASGAVDLTTGLPSLFQTGGIGALGRAVIWLAGAAAVAALAHWLDRRDAPVAAAAAALTLAVAVVVMTALSIVWSLNRAAPILAARAGTRTLRAIDGDARQLGVAYSPFRRLPIDDIPPLLPLTSGSPAAVKGGEPLASIVDAPAAAYAIEATLTGTASTVTAGLDRSPAPLASWDVTGVRGPWRRTFTLANDAHLLRVDGVPSGAGLDGVRVRAERRLGSHERVSNDEAWRAARYGSTTVFLLDGRSYVETGGCWIVGGSYAEFAIIRAPGTRVHLFVRNSGAQNRVTFDAGGWHDTLPLAPREERLLDLPIAGDRPGVVLQVTSPAGARPFDFEPGSQDKRFLGVWIETR